MVKIQQKSISIIRIKSMIFSIILLSFLAIIFSESISATDIFVNDSGGGDYTSIQEAIDAANESDTIQVASGTYNENIEINKTLILLGSGSTNTFINGINSTRSTIKITADNVYLSGLTIDNDAGQTNHHHCIFLQSVQYCTILENAIRNGENGIFLLISNNNIIEGNTIKNNIQKGIRLDSSHNNNIYNNDIRLNGDGVYTTNSDSNELHENDILQNGIGISLYSGSNNNYVYKNDFDENSGENAEDTGSNYWFKNGEGNYWDDYNDYDIDPEDGIGDSSYVINTEHDILDLYPLGDFLSYNQQPVAYIDSISPNPSIDGQTVSFQGHGTDDGIIITWEWSSSIDGVFGTSEDYSTSSLSSGTHTIRFRVKDNQDQWSSYDEISLSISPQNHDPPSDPPDNLIPTASIVSVSPLESIQGIEVYFHGYGSDSDGTIEEYQWQSSIDGNLSQQSYFSDTTLSIGTHTIIFKVKDNNDAWSEEVSIMLMVQESTSDNKKPVSYPQSPSEGKVNSSVLIDASMSYDPDGNITTYQWDFGDNKTGAGKIISHVYNEVGDYTISLTVTDNDGAETTNTTIISIVHTSSSDKTNETDPNKDENPTPSFELISLISSLFIVLYIVDRKRRI